MAQPTTEVVQMEYRNPDATAPLIVPVALARNTDDATIRAHISENSSRDIPWVAQAEAHRTPAIMVGGGPSMAEYLDEIQDLGRDGAVFAMNGASQFLRERGVRVDFQVIADAKGETAQLVDPMANAHLIASQVHPDTLTAARSGASDTRLWHLIVENIEDCLPDARRAAGGYVLIGGGAAVGNSAMALAYAMGYREFHVIGYDSSNGPAGETHAYDQPMNRFQPETDVRWGGKVFRSSLAMKAQAEKFQLTAQALQQEGCMIEVYGHGLLQHMWRTDPADLEERDKYRRMWQFEGYRAFSPGENLVWLFDKMMEIDKETPHLVVDFGCGTGRAMLALDTQGYKVLGIDFADNCRDQEALRLPFLEWDLAEPIPISGTHGYCTDVLEHIPTAQVQDVIDNIIRACPRVFFQISTVEDAFGAVLGTPLHLTVKPHEWWEDVLSRNARVTFQMDRGNSSVFVVEREEIDHEPV